MATPDLTVNLALALTFGYLDSDDIHGGRGSFTWTLSDSLADGTAADQADLLWWDTRTLAATSEDLDLAGGLTDVHDNVLTFATIKGIVIFNTSTTTTEKLAVGGAADNQFVNWVANASDINHVGPSGILMRWEPIDGYAVTGGTGDLLKIDSGSDTITYKIAIFGTSA